MDKPRQILLQVISDVFERMFFLFPEEDRPLPAAEWASYGITLGGPPDLRLRIAVPPGLGRLMAGNYLGLPAPEITAELVDATCREALNVIAGRFLAAVGGTQSLGLPETERGDDETWRRGVEEGSVLGLVIEDYPFLVEIRG